MLVSMGLKDNLGSRGNLEEFVVSEDKIIARIARVLASRLVCPLRARSRAHQRA
jgi:hypothetical protein